MSSHSDTTTPVPETDRAALDAVVEGPVLLPGDGGHGDETSPFNLSVRHRPALAVGAAGTADVRAAVRYAAERRRPVLVLSTGHGPALPATEEAVLINTRRMNGVTVDREARTARVGAGARWQQVVEAAAGAGLAPLVGSSPTVGVAGYTLGGGLSVTMGRAKGWAADHVRALDLVTPDGEPRHVSADSEADLFWGVRGAKSNFGVVTALEFALFPVRGLYAGGLFYAGEHTGKVLHAYQQFAAEAPDDVTSSIALYRLPDVPATESFMRGRLIVNVRISYLGSEEDGRRLIAPLRAAAPLVRDTVTTRPYREFSAISPGPTEPLRYVDHFRLLRGLPGEAVETLVEAAGPGSGSTATVVDIRQLGGALERPPVENAIQNHGAAFVIFTMTTFGPGQEVLSDAGTHLAARLRPWLHERLHPNFLAAGAATAEQVRSAYDTATYERLRTLKTTYDPANLFRFNHNIPPWLAGR